MPTISVRISEEEKKKLLKYGNLSDSVRDALDLFLKHKKSQEVLKKLAALQKKNPIRLDPEEIVRLIREDRMR